MDQSRGWVLTQVALGVAGSVALASWLTPTISFKAPPPSALAAYGVGSSVDGSPSRSEATAYMDAYLNGSSIRQADFRTTPDASVAPDTDSY